MSNTEIQLLALFRAPVVKLDDVSRDYLGLPPKIANVMASMNTLAVPTMRMSDSRKTPRMVRVADLATYVDARSSQALKEWEASQV